MSELSKARVTGLDLHIIVANSTTFTPASVATAQGGCVLLCNAASSKHAAAFSMRVIRAGRQHGESAKFDVAKAHTGPMNAVLLKFKAAADSVYPEPEDIPVAATPTAHQKVWDLTVWDLTV